MVWAISRAPHIKHVFEYVASALVSQGGYLVVMGLLITYTSPTHVALVTLGYSLIMWLSILSSWGMRQAYAIWCIKQPPHVRGLCTLHALRNLALGAVPTLIVLGMVAFYSFGVSLAVIMVVASGALFSMFSELLLQYYTYTSQPRRYRYLKAGHALLWGVATGVGIGAGGGAASCMIAYVATLGCMVSIGYIDLRRACYQNLEMRVTYPAMAQWWWLGVQYLPTLLAVCGVSYASRWMLASSGCTEYVAYWSVIEYIGPLFQATVLQAINTVYWPHAMTQYHVDERQAEVHMWHIMGMLAGFLIPAGMAGWWCALQVASWVLPVSYQMALPHGYFVILAHTFHALSYILMPRLHVREQVWPISVSLAGGLLVQLGYGWWAVARDGMGGCAIAVVLGQLVYLVLLVTLRYDVIRRSGVQPGYTHRMASDLSTRQIYGV